MISRDETRVPREFTESKPEGRREVGGLRRMEDVENDLRQLELER